MYIIPSNDKATPIVVSQGKPITTAVKRYLAKIGCSFYFHVNWEYESPKEKVQLVN